VEEGQPIRREHRHRRNEEQTIYISILFSSIGNEVDMRLKLNELKNVIILNEFGCWSIMGTLIVADSIIL
jgi:hypothetical protein